VSYNLNYMTRWGHRRDLSMTFSVIDCGISKRRRKPRRRTLFGHVPRPAEYPGHPGESPGRRGYYPGRRG
jgi:hypothetical protein